MSPQLWKPHRAHQEGASNDEKTFAMFCLPACLVLTIRGHQASKESRIKWRSEEAEAPRADAEAQSLAVGHTSTLPHASFLNSTELRKKNKNNQ